MDVFYNYQAYLYLQQTKKKPTDSELILAGALTQLGIDYQMQVQISDTTVDGLIVNSFAPAKIIIEVDGSYHEERKQKMIDIRRMVLHSHFGYHTIRVKNAEIEKDVMQVVQQIIGICKFFQDLEGKIYSSHYKDDAITRKNKQKG